MMPTPYQYQERSQESIRRRAERTGDWNRFTKPQHLIFKPKDGENCIRILPPTWDRAEHYGLTVCVHYRVGPDGASVLCSRRMQNRRCPICDAALQIEKEGGDPEEAAALRPREATLVWLIDRAEEDKGPQLWAMPVTKVDQEIIKHSQNRQTKQYYVIDHPTDGFDIYFDKSGKDIMTQYTGVSLANSSTPVDPLWLELIQEVPLPETLLWRSYEEVKALYDGGMDDPAAPARPGRPVAAAPQRQPAPGARQAPAMRPPPQQTRPAQGVAPRQAPGNWQRPAPQQQAAAPSLGRRPIGSNGNSQPPAEYYPAPTAEGQYPPQDEPQYDPNEYPEGTAYDPAQTDQQYAAPAQTNSAQERAAALRARFNRS
jgi:hypothetical protein